MEFVKENKIVNMQIDLFLSNCSFNTKKNNKSIIKKFLSSCSETESPTLTDYLYYFNEQEANGRNWNSLYIESTVIRRFLKYTYGLDMPRISRKQLSNN